MSPGTSPWSPQQRRWLQALGHAVLRVGGDEVEALPDTDAAVATTRHAEKVVAPVSRPVPPDQASSAAPARRAPPSASVEADPLDAPAAASAARAAPRRPSRLPDRLQLAMLRASGLDPSDPAAQEAMAQWPVDRLRGDGSAKRAFWPQLRALRRRS